MKSLAYATRLLILFLAVVPWYFAGTLVGTLTPARGLRICISANRFVLKVFQIKVSVENENPPEKDLVGCVFILLNQTSLLDSTLGSVSVPPPFRAIMNIEYALIPIVGWASAVFAWVIVRQWPAQAKLTSARIQKYLENGGNVGLSIEGTRSKDGALCPYKKGPVVIAIQTSARIIPVYFEGAKNCMPYGSWRVRPGHVRVRFLRAIATEGLSYDDRNKVVGHLRSLAEREMARLENGQSAQEGL